MCAHVASRRVVSSTNRKQNTKLLEQDDGGVEHTTLVLPHHKPDFYHTDLYFSFFLKKKMKK